MPLPPFLVVLLAAGVALSAFGGLVLRLARAPETRDPRTEVSRMTLMILGFLALVPGVMFTLTAALLIALRLI